MLKTKIRAPFFELGPKNYIIGKKVEDLAHTIRKTAEKYDIRVLYSVPFFHTEKVAEIFEGSEHCYVTAPFMDDIPESSKNGMAIPERLVASGVQAVYINHSARPHTLAEMIRLQARAEKLGIYTIACSDSQKELHATAIIEPDIIIAEPEALIGSQSSADVEYIRSAVQTIKSVNPNISALIAAGIKTGDDVYRCIYNGADASGSASGIFGSPDPEAKIHEFFEATRRARDDRCNDK